MGSWFANSSLDPDEPPRHFWTEADEETLQRRMGYADSVVVGALRVVSQYSQRSQPNQITLAFRPDEVLFGDAEDQDEEELVLRLKLGSKDFQVALAIQQQLPGARYLLFLKKTPGEDGSKLRWAFYRPTPKLLNELRTRYRWLSRHKASAQL